MNSAVVEKKSFNDLYLNEYDRSIVLGDLELPELIRKDMGESSGTVLRATDKYGRRVIILVGEGHNIMIYDRFPGIPGSRFGLVAVPQIKRIFSSQVTEVHIPHLMELAFTDYPVI